MRKYLVTGGAGFIGSHMVELLLSQGHKVSVLDDLSTGKRENVPDGVPLIVGDVADLETVKNAFEGIDGCVHLAAIASVDMSNKFWRRTHDVNSTGTVNVFEAAIPKKIPVVYASSAAIYGSNPHVPLRENERPDPQTAYGADKYSCELSGRVASDIHGVPNIGCRFFNVYGPRQDPHSPYSGVISIFAERINGEKDISIFGDGTQTRDFIYVGDVVNTLYKCLDGLVNKEKTGCNVINVCTKRSTTVSDLADIIENIVGKHVKHCNEPARPGDIHTSIGNPELASSWLGVTNNTQLKDGLKILLNSK